MTRSRLLIRSSVLVIVALLSGARAAEARTYFVSPSGSDQADGSALSPLRGISRAAALARAGDRVLVKAGVYRERVVVANAGEPRRPITFEASPPGQVEMTGDAGFQPAQWAGDDDVVASSGGGWVTIRGFVFRHIGTPYVVRASRGWRIERCLFQDTGFGVNIRGHDVVVARTTFEDINGPNAHAVVAVGSRDVLLQDDIIRRVNSQRQIGEIPRSAVTKFVETDGLRVERLLSEDNVGPGLWLDWDNRDFTIRDSTIRRNKGDRATWEGGGLWLEGNGNAHGSVTNNAIYGNTGPGISVMESGGIEITHNRLENNSECIELRNMKRDETGARAVRSLDIADNVCAGWSHAGIATSIGDWSVWSPGTMDIVFHGNKYRSAGSAPVFDWLGRSYGSVDQVRSSLGFETANAATMLPARPDTVQRR